MKRIRVFAGPNGSGKTSLFYGLKNDPKIINKQRHINPDYLNSLEILDFNQFGLKVEENNLKNCITSSTFYKKSEININDISIKNNRLEIINRNSYIGAILADFLRNSLLQLDERLFSYETVLSHYSKIDFLKKAKNNGWSIYLYFVSTNDVEINCARVLDRISKGGHSVPRKK